MRIAWRTVGSIIARVWADTGGAVDQLAGLSRIGIDEVSYRRGRLFLMVVIDHDTGRLVWAGKGQSKATLQEFFTALGPDRCAAITHVSADSAKYIADVVAANCPDAVQVADPFHVVKWANDALGELRLQAWRDARKALRANPKRPGRPAKGDPPHREAQRVHALTKVRYSLWKNPENLTDHQQARLEWLAVNDTRLYRAYLLKEGLRWVFKVKGQAGKDALDRWISWARRSRIPAFVDLQRRIVRNRPAIDATLDHGLSNGLIESTNTKIRVLTRVAYGFHTPQPLIALALLAFTIAQS